MNLLLGDCLEQLKTLPDNSVDSVVTDPPYFLLNDSGKGFMGKEWDSLSRENVIVESLLKSMHLSLDKKDVADFAQELVLTKQEALVLCKGLLPSLITVVEKLPDHVQFVQNHLFTVLSTPRSTVQNIADMWQGETKWLAQTTTSTFTDNQSKTILVTEGQSGNGSESKSTSETTTDVNDATSIAVDSKSSVTTSHPIAFQEVMKKVISSPSVKAVIKQFTSIPHSMAIISAAFHERWAREVLRVLKPGGHMLAFSGTRVYQHLATGVEASGFECRDMVSWLHGQGFPKSHNVSKAIDKEAGAEREVVGLKDLKKPNAQKAGQSFSSNLEEGSTNKTMFGPNSLSHQPITTPATDLAKKWDGWGSALKPSLEPIILARKPLSEKTLAQNVVKHGTGALNIDGCRIGTEERTNPAFGVKGWREKEGRADIYEAQPTQVQGRWPSHTIFDEDAAEMLDEQSGQLSKQGSRKLKDCPSEMFAGGSKDSSYFGDTGGASRFFKVFESEPCRFLYQAKASKSERNKGCEGLPLVKLQDFADGTKRKLVAQAESEKNPNLPRQNFHPTVKSIKLMEYLIKLITPTGGTVHDPFAGSFSTGVAAATLGFDFIGIEKEKEYFDIGVKRLQHVQLSCDKPGKDKLSSNSHSHLDHSQNNEKEPHGEHV